MCVLDILDTAGQEEFSAMRDSYFRLGEGFLIVYSVRCRLFSIHTHRERNHPFSSFVIQVSDKTSFASVESFHSKILRVKNVGKFPIVVVANKIDVPPEERVVSTTEGKELSDILGVPYLEV